MDVPPEPRRDADDVLGRALDALRAQDVPDGPSRETADGVVAALREAAGRSDARWTRRLVMYVKRHGRMAAVVSLTLTGLAVAAALWVGGVGGTVAFADVARAIREARTLRYTVTVRPEGAHATITYRVVELPDGRSRQEMTPGGAVHITDLGRGAAITLDPARKLAIRMDLKDAVKDRRPDEARPLDLLAHFKELLRTAKAEPVGKRRVAGGEAQGFVVAEGGTRWTIWADAKTGTPLEVETVVNKAGVTIGEFVLNAPADEKLFALDVPEGYRVQDLKLDAPRPLEDDLAEVLGAYARKRDGRFPADLNDWADITKALLADVMMRPAATAPATQPAGLPPELEKQLMKVSQTAGRITATLATLEPGDWAYTPGDAKLGDAGKVIFWHRPKGAEKAQVLYADLTKGEAKVEGLPKPN